MYAVYVRYLKTPISQSVVYVHTYKRVKKVTTVVNCTSAYFWAGHEIGLKQVMFLATEIGLKYVMILATRL